MHAERIIVIRPEDLAIRKTSALSEQIVQTLINFDELDVVGISTAVFLPCSAINIARSIADIHISRLYIDYLEIPIVGKFEAIFFTLSRKMGLDIEAKMRELDSKMNLTIGKEGQLIAVSRRERLERLTSLCLWKLREFPRVKILGAGMAISNAVATALQVSRAGISKDPIAIEFIGLSTIQSRETDKPPKPVSAIDIYLTKGNETQYDERHLKIIEHLRSRIGVAVP